MTLISEPPTTTYTPRVGAGSTLHLTAAAPSLWRVIDTAGRIVGHVQALGDERGIRYRARRFRSAASRFIDLGDFWSAEDAIECLRYSR